jgi:pimeloyl-ACP methyl ester carboxylesterase
MPEARQAPIVASMVNMRGWASALLTEPTPLAAFARLDIPVLYMTGSKSTAAAHGVARILTQTLPSVEVVAFEGMGHMGPVTHPEVVNRVIADFLART